MQRGDESVRQSIEILVTNGGQVNQMHAPVSCRSVPFPAINRDVVTAGSQPHGEFFRERFEAPVIGRNAARAENRDAHGAYSDSPAF